MRIMYAVLGTLATGAAAMGQVWGGFGPLATVYSSADVRDMLSADLNGDGVDDIVASLAASPQPISLFLSTAPDSFAARIDLDVSGITSGIKRVAALDIDADLDVDLVSVSLISPFDIRVWTNDGTGVFAVGQSILDSPGLARGLAAGDLNGDGAPDVAVRIDGGVSILLNDGFGTLGAAVSFAVPGSATMGAITTLDIDADGIDDVVVGDQTSNVIRVLRSDGATLTEVQAVGSPGQPASLNAGDLNGDGAPDVVVGTRDGGGSIRVYLNDGAGAFTSGFTDGVGFAEDLELGDLDADGNLDIVTEHTNGAFSRAYFNDGTGGAFTSEDYSAGGFVNRVALGDVDGNGSPDLLVAERSGNTIRRRLNQTDVLPPGAFDLVSPADGSVALPLPETLSQWPGGKAGTAPLQWTTVTGFQNIYTVRIAEDPGLNMVVLEQTSGPSPFNVPDGVLEIGTRYYWSVEVENPIGVVVPTSGAFTFLTRAIADLNADGEVNGADLGLLLGSWGVTQ